MRARQQHDPLYALLWLLLLILSPPAFANVAVPPLTARVMDQTQTLSAQDIGAISQKLQAFEQQKGSQIAVLIVRSTAPETIEQYGIRVAEAWKLGRKGVDDGVLLLIAKDDRTMRIEVGYGLEGALPDAIAKRIISEVMTPYFQRGDFNGGVQAGVDGVMGAIKGEPLPAVQQGPASESSLSVLEQWAAPLLFAVMFLGGMLKLLLGQLLGAMAAGLLIMGLVWLLLGNLLIALVVGVMAFVFALTGLGRGGFYGGGSRGGLGGGGFSGGGGRFGGGGASGRW